jgi:hypothetical protein
LLFNSADLTRRKRVEPSRHCKVLAPIVLHCADQTWTKLAVERDRAEAAEFAEDTVRDLQTEGRVADQKDSRHLIGSWG